MHMSQGSRVLLGSVTRGYALKEGQNMFPFRFARV